MRKNPADKTRNRPSEAKLRRVVYLERHYAEQAEGVDLSALVEWALAEAPLHRFPQGSRKNRRKKVPDIDSVTSDTLFGKKGGGK